MIDEMDLDQPWVAPSAPKFKEGDHVRVRLSAECPLPVTQRSLYAFLGETKFHGRHEDGVKGVIRHIYRSYPNGHNVSVETDAFDVGDGKVIERWLEYAPIELELLP